MTDAETGCSSGRKSRESLIESPPFFVHWRTPREGTSQSLLAWCGRIIEFRWWDVLDRLTSSKWQVTINRPVELNHDPFTDQLSTLYITDHWVKCPVELNHTPFTDQLSTLYIADCDLTSFSSRASCSVCRRLETCSHRHRMLKPQLQLLDSCSQVHLYARDIRRSCTCKTSCLDADLTPALIRTRTRLKT